jgi:MFS family permease
LALVGAALGSLLAGSLSSIIGRKLSIMLSDLFLIAGSMILFQA